MAVKISSQKERELAEFIAQFYDDPYGFVMAVYPWGEPTLPDGTLNPLRDKKGPEPWQEKMLKDLGEHIRENTERVQLECDMLVWRSAIASGHGVGKSAIVAWLIHFFMCTRVDTRGAVTASTQTQLETRTWPELAKWHNMLLVKHWFVWTATAYAFAHYPEDRRKNYRIDAATVSEYNTEAFAGLHNEGKSILVMFDEASGVNGKIWEVAEGALTDGEAFFFAFGNPTSPTGEFADCFDKHKDLYRTANIDSRSVSHTNKTALNDTIRKYGIDSDEVKVRILGEFPAQSFNGFIALDGVKDAQERELIPDYDAALIMAVDVARFGNDTSVIGFRQGRDARSRPFRSFAKLSVTKLAEIVAVEANFHRPDAIVIESTGPGAGVIDILRDKGFKIVEVHPGSAANDFNHYMNKRAENWAKMRDHIYDGLCISNDEELEDQLTKILYTLDRHEQRILLEPKEVMKKRGLPSPDKADTLSLTYAVTIARRDRNNIRNAARTKLSKLEDNPLGF